MVIGYTDKGLESMSHNMHDYANKYILKNKEIRHTRFHLSGW